MEQITAIFTQNKQQGQSDKLQHFYNSVSSLLHPFPFTHFSCCNMHTENQVIIIKVFSTQFHLDRFRWKNCYFKRMFLLIMFKVSIYSLIGISIVAPKYLSVSKFKCGSSLITSTETHRIVRYNKKQFFRRINKT